MSLDVYYAPKHSTKDLHSSFSHTPFQENIIKTKIRIPRLYNPCIQRSSLFTQLRQNQDGKITLLCAPVGYGKTTLLVSWLHYEESPSIWISLDPEENDIALFFSYIIAALQPLLSIPESLTSTIFASLHDGHPEQAMAILINTITMNVAVPFTFILDDYHSIQNSAIHNVMAFLMKHLPPQMHLFISTRFLPPLPIARLRANGKLNLLSTNHLRFSHEETLAFFNSIMKLSLDEASINTIEYLTEGWIAGIHMMARSFQNGPHQLNFDLASSNYHIFQDYFLEEVFTQVSEPLQHFLLSTCILDQFSANLYHDLTGLNNGTSMIALLEQMNLFMIPLDDTHQYRYHRLFSHALRMYLRQHNPGYFYELHQKAGIKEDQRTISKTSNDTEDEFSHKMQLMDQAPSFKGNIPNEFSTQQQQNMKPTKRSSLLSTDDIPGRSTLSNREIEVLYLVAQGASNQEISNQLVIAISTVKRHLINIFSKLDATNRTQAVARARTLNLLQ